MYGTRVRVTHNTSPAVTLADGQQVPTSGTATAVVRHARGSMSMPNSVHAPGLKSLLSVSETAQQFDILFQAQRSYIVQKQPTPFEGDLIATATQIGGVYRLDVATDATTANAATSALDLYDCYLRLGHPSTSVLRQAVREQQVLGFPKTLPQATIECSSCAIGKQACNPLPTHPTPLTTTRLERVSADLCGPFEPTLSGSRYMALHID
jgi:hypothetical protein